MPRKIKRSKFALIFVLVAASLIVLQPMDVSAFKAGAHSVLVMDVANSLPQDSVIRTAILKYPKLAAWGSTGPDIPANTAAIVIDRAPWFEKYHYEKAGSMAAEQLRLALASGDEQAIAFAAGWLTHEVGDLYCHGVFVNPDPQVGGVYLANPDSKEMHGKLEAYADKVLFEDRSNPKRTYNPSNMKDIFGDFTSASALRNAQIASLNVHGETPSADDYSSWTNFFTTVYLNTGAAGLDNWVYSNSYKEASDKLKGGVQNIPGEPGYNLNRMQRLNLAYDSAKQFSALLLAEAEDGNYHNFSNAWNLDAYHFDNRSIGTLTVSIKTDTDSGSGTDDDIWFGMILENGDKWESPVLNKALYNDFENGDYDDYYLYVDRKSFPIEKINKIYLKKESDGIAGGWKVRTIRVSVNGQDLYNKNINTWLEDDHLTWTGDIIREEPTQRIFVGLTGEANAYSDKVQGFAYTLNGGSSVPYVGEVQINIKRENGTSENYRTICDAAGKFSYSNPLKPQDYVKLSIDKVDETNDKIIYSGRLELGYAKVPFDRIDFIGDAFNDVVRGEVSEQYSGPLEIIIENDSGRRVLNANAANGKFSVPASLAGKDRIKVSLKYEGMEYPMEPLLHEASLDTLEMKYTATATDISGTIFNNCGISAKPYTGDVNLYSLMSDQLVAKQKAIAEKPLELKVPISMVKKAANNSTSAFLFKNVMNKVKLGFSIVIEHDGITKMISYDPLSDVNAQSNLPNSKDVYSIMEQRFNPRINPFENSLNPIENSINPGLNQGINLNVQNSNIQGTDLENLDTLLDNLLDTWNKK